MFTISSVLPTIQWMTPSNYHVLRRKPSINYNTNHFLQNNFGQFCPSSQVPRLQVQLDDVPESSEINHFVKNSDEEMTKKKSYVCDDYIVRQNFLVRLYELDVHQNASLETLLNYTAETCLNLFQSSGLVVGGFGVSKEMTSRNLIWAIGRIHAVINSYPSWGDMIQVETWCSALGKHSLTCSSRFTNVKTGNKLIRVDSEFVMINEITRRLSRMPEVIKALGQPYVRDDFDPINIATNSDDKLRKIQKLDFEKALHIQTGIRPLWFDLDPNQHVNNAKYISWILEGTPESVRENEELGAIILEYRRECKRHDVLKSLSAASSDEHSQELDHLLCLENNIEVARARTLWRSKSKN